MILRRHQAMSQVQGMPCAGGCGSPGKLLLAWHFDCLSHLCMQDKFNMHDVQAQIQLGMQPNSQCATNAYAVEWRVFATGLHVLTCPHMEQFHICLFGYYVECLSAFISSWPVSQAGFT